MERTKPFLKWAGGKGQLLSQLEAFLPDTYNKYYEPFLGGGALFFYLNPKKASVNDINPNLIETYRAVKAQPEELIKILKRLEQKYHRGNEDEQKLFYYKTRTRYNEARLDSLTKSAYLIFLNKTGFNGMYRENAKGKFNIPFGQHKKPTICNVDGIREASKLLQHTTITCGPFEKAVQKAGKGDFVYLDPPYYPLSTTSSFTSYTGQAFLEEEQLQLFELYRSLDSRGCHVMQSNSKAPFISELYKKFRLETVMAGRSINSQGTGRGKIEELVILNY
jgi:DNA adenine methylase